MISVICHDSEQFFLVRPIGFPRLTKMSQVDKILVEPIAIVPTEDACGIFLGDGAKVILFYTEPAVGAAINAALTGAKPPRPMTHDLMKNFLVTFGARISQAAIIGENDGVFFARLFLEAENEIMERKIVELDARPSDAIALALRAEAPIYVIKSVWENQKDMSDLLERMRREEETPEELS